MSAGRRAHAADASAVGDAASAAQQGDSEATADGCPRTVSGTSSSGTAPAPPSALTDALGTSIVSPQVSVLSVASFERTVSSQQPPERPPGAPGAAQRPAGGRRGSTGRAPAPKGKGVLAGLRARFDSKPTVPEGVRSIDPAFRERCHLYYAHYCPEKLRTVDDILARRAADPQQLSGLWGRITERYGPWPPGDRPAAGSAQLQRRRAELAAWLRESGLQRYSSLLAGNGCSVASLRRDGLSLQQLALWGVVHKDTATRLAAEAQKLRAASAPSGEGRPGAGEAEDADSSVGANISPAPSSISTLSPGGGAGHELAGQAPPGKGKFFSKILGRVKSSETSPVLAAEDMSAGSHSPPRRLGEDASARGRGAPRRQLPTQQQQEAAQGPSYDIGDRVEFRTADDHEWRGGAEVDAVLADGTVMLRDTATGRTFKSTRGNLRLSCMWTHADDAALSEARERVRRSGSSPNPADVAAIQELERRYERFIEQGIQSMKQASPREKQGRRRFPAFFSRGDSTSPAARSREPSLSPASDAASVNTCTAQTRADWQRPGGDHPSQHPSFRPPDLHSDGQGRPAQAFFYNGTAWWWAVTEGIDGGADCTAATRQQDPYAMHPLSDPTERARRLNCRQRRRQRRQGGAAGSPTSPRSPREDTAPVSVPSPSSWSPCGESESSLDEAGAVDLTLPELVQAVDSTLRAHILGVHSTPASPLISSPRRGTPPPAATAGEPSSRVLWGDGAGAESARLRQLWLASRECLVAVGRREGGELHRATLTTSVCFPSLRLLLLAAGRKPPSRHGSFCTRPFLDERVVPVPQPPRRKRGMSGCVGAAGLGRYMRLLTRAADRSEEGRGQWLRALSELSLRPLLPVNAHWSPQLGPTARRGAPGGGSSRRSSRPFASPVRQASVYSDDCLVMVDAERSDTVPSETSCPAEGHPRSPSVPGLPTLALPTPARQLRLAESPGTPKALHRRDRGADGARRLSSSSLPSSPNPRSALTSRSSYKRRPLVQRGASAGSSRGSS
eukprot:TRINITY_DN24590_c0_g1_i1.p1 TRINITY_DN24590_c0_g1~~TRINITY_DN24590_c0_g1_i1.p1  ORF type:complete len:1018 (+),score=234.68 TRINITY_DN24590_c0_g1_i1:92-3145(+)